MGEPLGSIPPLFSTLSPGKDPLIRAVPGSGDGYRRDGESPLPSAAIPIFTSGLDFEHQEDSPGKVSLDKSHPLTHVHHGKGSFSSPIRDRGANRGWKGEP